MSRSDPKTKKVKMGTDLGMPSSRVIENATIVVNALVRKAHRKMDIPSSIEMFKKIILQIFDVNRTDMPIIKAMPQNKEACPINSGPKKRVSRNAKASHGAAAAQHTSGKAILYRRFARDAGTKGAMSIVVDISDVH
jgi:hypothetical protein